MLSHLHLFPLQAQLLGFFWSIKSIVELYIIFPPNFQYLSLIYSHIPLTVLDANVLKHLVFFSTQLLCLQVPYVITSCSLKFNDIVTYVLKIFLLGSVFSSFQFIPQSSVGLSSFLIEKCFPHYKRTEISHIHLLNF